MRITIDTDEQSPAARTAAPIAITSASGGAAPTADTALHAASVQYDYPTLNAGAAPTFAKLKQGHEARHGYTAQSPQTTIATSAGAAPEAAGKADDGKQQTGAARPKRK